MNSKKSENNTDSAQLKSDSFANLLDQKRSISNNTRRKILLFQFVLTYILYTDFITHMIMNVT